jgi:hypothetical protein
VALGVAWGLLCVGVRHVALKTGLDMQELVARRSEALARVQTLERQMADARQLERIEAVAAGLGFVKPMASQMVIVAPEPERGLLSRLFGRVSVAASQPPPAGPDIRSRDEVTVTKRIIKKPVKHRRTPRKNR